LPKSTFYRRIPIDQGWTDRYPLITVSALRNDSTSLAVDGEAVLLNVDGISDFDGLHSRK
jgi:bifunctional non-homologous end joining protein LigD